MNPWRFFDMAAIAAVRGEDERNHRLGAVGVRYDGTAVTAVNGPARDWTPRAHAENRLARKLDKGAIVFVARVGADGAYRMAKPCAICEAVLRVRKVRRVFYTIGEGEYGVLELN